MPVPGGALHYRITGRATGNLFVIENGWGASFSMAAWLQQALAAHAGVLCYDRAGVGDSKSLEPLTPARITEQLVALLAGLGASKPVVVIGHSYGGLIAALHAAQAPGRIRAIVQVDPTPEQAYPGDAALKYMPATATLMKLAIRCGLGRHMYSGFRELPADAFARLTQSRAWMARTVDGSVPEIRLLENIRGVIRSAEGARRCPRLVISAEPMAGRRSALVKLLYSEEKRAKAMAIVTRIHRQQAEQSAAGRWMVLPYGHLSLLANRTAAEEVAARTLAFVRAL